MGMCREEEEWQVQVEEKFYEAFSWECAGRKGLVGADYSI